MPCKFCGVEKRRVDTHERFCRKNPARELPFPLGGENRALLNAKINGRRIGTHLSSENRLKISLALKCRIVDQDVELKRRAKISAAGKGRFGGYIPGSGRGIKGVCFGIRCDSSWEAAFVIWAKSQNLSILRNTVRLPLVGNFRKTYTPDFVVNGTLVEIKGYETAESLAKKSQYPNVDWYGAARMAPILKFARITAEFKEYLDGKLDKRARAVLKTERSGN